MSQQTTRRLAWSSATFSIVVVASGLLLNLLAIFASRGRISPKPHQLFEPLVTLSFSLVGALVASHHPRNPIGWILSATGFLSALDLLALGYELFSRSVTANNSLPGLGLATWLGSWLWVFGISIPLSFLLLLFPNGRLPSPRWWPVAWLAASGLAAGVLGATLGALVAEAGGRDQASLLPIASAADVLVSAAGPLLGVGCLGSLASLVVRFRRSSGEERAQLKWLVYALGFSVLIVVLAGVVPPALGLGSLQELVIFSTGVAILAIILAVGIAIARHRLYEIDLVINRTLVYGALTGMLAGLYLLVVGALGVLLNARGNLALSLLGVGLVAVVVQPVRERLQHAVNRLMYGERDEPYQVLSDLGQRLEAAIDPNATLPAIVETVAKALKLPYAELAVKQGRELRRAANYGTRSVPADRLVAFPLVYIQETVGELRVAPRAPGEALALADLPLLTQLARQAGAAVHTVQITRELERSLQRMVNAREEARRRLGSDLHDGLGHRLASLLRKAEAAAELVHGNPGDLTAAERLLTELQEQARTAIDEVRALAHTLHPPELELLGLVGALRERIRDHQQADGGANGLQISIEAPEALPAPPAAVEAAAYYIAQEALTNVARHAGARHCCVRLRLLASSGEGAEGSTGTPAALELEVSDDGRGLGATGLAGLGLTSMRERALELGGSCVIQSPVTGGTCVLARLPYPPA
jgi:signal transduction histidine kinase